MAEVLPDLLVIAEGIGDPQARQRLAEGLRREAPDAPAAQAAVSTAMADLAVRAQGVPLYRQWGLDPAAAPPTSYTVGIADPPEHFPMSENAAGRGGHDDQRHRRRRGPGVLWDRGRWRPFLGDARGWNARIPVADDERYQRNYRIPGVSKPQALLEPVGEAVLGMAQVEVVPLHLTDGVFE